MNYLLSNEFHAVIVIEFSAVRIISIIQFSVLRNFYYLIFRFEEESRSNIIVRKFELHRYY